MKNNIFIMVSFLTMVSMLLSIPLYSQDKELLLQADSLHQQGRVLFAAEKYKEAIELFRKAAEIRAGQLGDEAADLAYSFNNLGLCYLYQGDANNALNNFLQALPILEKQPESDKDDYLGCLENIGYCYEEIGDPSKALKYYQQALASTEIIYGNDHSRFAEFLDRIGTVYTSLDDYATAQKCFEQSLVIWEMNDNKSPDCAISLYNIGSCLSEQEDYEKAIKYYQRALEIFESTYGKENEDYAICSGNIGTCLFTLGNYEKALEYYKLALTSIEAIYGQEHPDYLNAINGIGICYGKLADNSMAIVYFQQALEIGKSLYGEEHPVNAMSLTNIGVSYGQLGDFNKALEYYQQALAIREKINGKENSSYAAVLDNIGICYRNLSDYTKALEYHQQALAIIEKINGKEHSSYATILGNIGQCYSVLCDYSKALESYQQALSIREIVYGKEHPDYAQSLNNIANCYRYLCDYDSALEYHQQALAIVEKVFGKEHPSYADGLNNIALSYADLGEYGKALECHQQALTIREKVYGKEHPDYAQSLNNIGSCFRKLGNYPKALEYHRQALAIREKIYGEEHPFCASVLNDIGICYSSLGDSESAISFFKQAQTAFERYGEDNTNFAMTLNNIGLCYMRLGDYTNALEYYQHSSEIFEKTLGKGHLNYALSLNNIGDIYRKNNDHANALRYYQQALEIRKDRLGPKNIDYTSTLYSIAWRYYYLKDYSHAEESLVEWADNSAEITTSLFSYLPEVQREAFWAKRYQSIYTNELYDLATRLPSPICITIAYNGALLGKGLLLNAETEMRKLILESHDEDALRLYNEVLENRVKVDKLYEDPVGKKNAIDSLNNSIESRQQELIKRCKVFGDYTRNLALKWTDVQASLRKKDIAIEFETYTHQDTTFYIALTLRPGYTEPHLVELFNSRDLAEISSKRYYTSTRLTELVWGKLAGELNGVQNVYFSPVGELNNIGIEYLLDEDGEHLISKKRNYYRLTSTRELVKAHIGRKMTDVTLYGGIRYDISPSSNLTGDETESDRLAITATRSWMPIDSLSITRGGWVYLPGTKEEAEAISTTLSSKHVQNDLLEGESGTEESFKALSGAMKDVIHIATHGFYWTETEVTRSGMETSSFMLNEDSKAPKEDKALTRSGLLFAGAQNAFDGKDIPLDVEDGILTAKDISRMDLRGTDLVVISACQSGLGEVTGDGVFGLQRGFKKAGVQSIVMSLWEVSDEATKIMMTRFYENLARGRSKYDSFRDAQNYLRKYDDGIYDEPEYYAAFVLLDAIN